MVRGGPEALRSASGGGELTGHHMNAVAAQVPASRDYLFAANGQRADTLADMGTSPR